MLGYHFGSQDGLNVLTCWSKGMATFYAFVIATILPLGLTIFVNRFSMAFIEDDEPAIKSYSSDKAELGKQVKVLIHETLPEISERLTLSNRGRLDMKAAQLQELYIEHMLYGVDSKAYRDLIKSEKLLNLLADINTIVNKSN